MRLPLTDSHCHLDQYPEDHPIWEDLRAGLRSVMAVSLDPADFEATFQRLSAFPCVLPAVGFFPDPMRSPWPQLERMLELARTHRWIGEIGLDGVDRDADDRRRQAEAFDRILDAAAEQGNAVLSIHSRRASHEVVQRLRGGFPGTAILHWFSGTAQEVEALSEHVWFSVNTAMTASEQGRKRIRRFPRDRILLESDGPYIQVEGRPAVPSDLERVLQFFSGEWQMSLEKTAARLQENARRAGLLNEVDTDPAQ